MKIPHKIGVFKRFLSEKTTMKYGYYFDGLFDLPFHKDKRHIRVWLPEDYDFDDPSKRFPVIYFSDGQNLVDRYLAAYGEWELDRTSHKLKREGYSSFIAVGIDCPIIPDDRSNELNPPYPPNIPSARRRINHPHADKYIDYIADTLKPLIDKSFFTMKEKEATGIGGSSMGGIMAFYAYIYRPDVFGYSLSFSPAFFFYHKRNWFKILDKYDINPEKNGKLFLYVGGKDFEKVFVKRTLETFHYLEDRGFDQENLGLIFDSREPHHEKAWAKYLPEALKLWLK